VQGLAEVTPGVIWASKSSEGLYLWDGRYFRSLPAAGLSPGDGSVGALLMAKDGSCWMGGAHGLLQFKDVSASKPPRVAGVDQPWMSARWRKMRRAGYGWGRGKESFGGRTGSWAVAGTEQRSAVHAITALVPERDGSIWVGTAGDGLFSVEGKADGHWTKRKRIVERLDSHALPGFGRHSLDRNRRRRVEPVEGWEGGDFYHPRRAARQYRYRKSWKMTRATFGWEATGASSVSASVNWRIWRPKR
jgi:hypothetical protein